MLHPVPFSRRVCMGEAYGQTMSQGDLPAIHGTDWTPKEPLVFSQPLHADAARTEILRFAAHDMMATFSLWRMSGMF